MIDYKKEFGKNVKKFRSRKGFSQEQLAEIVGLGSKSISPIERGYSFISIDKLPKLCEALGVSAFELFVCDLDKENDFLLKSQIFEKLKACKHSELINLNNVLDAFLKR